MKTFKKYFELPTSPDQVYLALTNPITIQLWSGAEAQMSTEVGSEFSLFDGDICGKNLEFEENKKIVHFSGRIAPFEEQKNLNLLAKIYTKQELLIIYL